MLGASGGHGACPRFDQPPSVGAEDPIGSGYLLPRHDGLSVITGIRELGVRAKPRASEIANRVLFLASDQASFVTGISLAADGGTIAGVRAGG